MTQSGLTLLVPKFAWEFMLTLGPGEGHCHPIVEAFQPQKPGVMGTFVSAPKDAAEG